MFRIACGLRERGGWEVQPSEFWRLTPREWWLLYDVNIGDAIKAQTDRMDRLKRLYRESQT